MDVATGASPGTQRACGLVGGLIGRLAGGLAMVFAIRDRQYNRRLEDQGGQAGDRKYGRPAKMRVSSIVMSGS